MTEEAVEAFVAGAISSRNEERNRLFEEVMALQPLSVDYVEYVRLEDVLTALKRGLS